MQCTWPRLYTRFYWVCGSAHVVQDILPPQAGWVGCACWMLTFSVFSLHLILCLEPVLLTLTHIWFSQGMVVWLVDKWFMMVMAPSNSAPTRLVVSLSNYLTICLFLLGVKYNYILSTNLKNNILPTKACYLFFLCVIQLHHCPKTIKTQWVTLLHSLLTCFFITINSLCSWF